MRPPFQPCADRVPSRSANLFHVPTVPTVPTIPIRKKYREESGLWEHPEQPERLEHPGFPKEFADPVGTPHGSRVEREPGACPFCDSSLVPDVLPDGRRFCPCCASQWREDTTDTTTEADHA